MERASRRDDANTNIAALLQDEKTRHPYRKKKHLARPPARPRRGGGGPWVAEVGGFNVHSGVLVHAGDREGRERLFR